jgi:alkylated DNA repair dioxygenase AlkB
MKNNLPLGTSYISNFLSNQEQLELISFIDQSIWLSDLKRRVQHYGYKYNYTTKRIDSSLYLGTLPSIFTFLNQKMIDLNLIKSNFDQVIVNEYLVSQGISKHIDCIPCFENEIVILSLLEEWEILFSKNDVTMPIPLAPGSLLLIKDEARYQWRHEIPNRVFEPSGLERTKRVSVTFRKVIL